MKEIKGTKLVILNAGSTYVRMFVCAGLTLFSSRWILAALGEEDFGLFAVVGGIMSVLSFLTNAMAGSAQRHFAYAIGQGDVDEVNKWFNASLRLHLLLALTLTIVGLPFGRYMIDNVLTIPTERIGTCHIVFICSIIVVFFNVIIVPYIGMFIAMQRIFEQTIYQVVKVIFMFVFAYFLSTFNYDNLLLYSWFMVFITILFFIVQVARCSFNFKECKFQVKNINSISYIKELVTFGGWSLFGTLGAIASNQGMAFLVNIFHGPKINASFGISNQVSGQVNGMGEGLHNAIAPEITASEGRGDRQRSLAFSLLASKFSALAMCLVFIPLMFELDTILSLWLINVPDYTASICRYVLVAQLILLLNIGYTILVRAHGKIAGYQSSLGSVVLCAPLIAWAMFRVGFSVELCIGLPLIFVRIFNTGLRLWWVNHLLEISPLRWFKDVLLRFIVSVLIPLISAAYVCYFFDATVIRMIAMFVICPTMIISCSWLFGLNDFEKSYLIGFFASIIKKIRSLGAPAYS